MATETGEITLLLARWRDGEESVFEELMPLVYPHLRQVAAAYMPPATQFTFSSGIKVWGAGSMAQVQAWVGSNGVSARRHYRRYHNGHRPYYRPYYYYARPYYYRPYPYASPAPFTFGFGFGPFW